MHIAIVGPIATADIAPILGVAPDSLPKGYPGAPLLVTLIAELIKRGHRVSAFTLSADMDMKGPAAASVYGAGLSVTYVKMRPRAWRFSNGRVGRILDLYREERHTLTKEILSAVPDVVHGHWSYEFALATLATGLPHVITCHDSPVQVARFFSHSRPTQSLYRWIRVVMALKALREAKCVTAVSPYLKAAVQAMTANQIEVVPNPIDAVAFGLGKVRSAPQQLKIAMVCNGWEKRKNPVPALQAFSMVRTARPEAELHLFGVDFGPLEAAEQWCVRQGISDGLIFHGATNHMKLLAKLSTMSVLVHPSLEETFGMVIAEAMALGLPVVAGENSGAVPWVVNGVGELTDIRDVGAIAAAVSRVLEPTKYRDCSMKGIREATERFSVSSIADRYIALYTRVTS